MNDQMALNGMKIGKAMVSDEFQWRSGSKSLGEEIKSRYVVGEDFRAG